jgi:predicted negative regulator of RcsB-dependent stress response
MIRRFLTRVLILILIAVCGYNVWQVRQLQEQMTRVETQLQIATEADAKASAARPAQVSHSWLDQADRHAERARQAIGRGDFTTAQRELEKGVDDVHRAIRTPEAQTEAKLGAARQTLASLQSQADSLWRKVRALHPASIP